MSKMVILITNIQKSPKAGALCPHRPISLRFW